MIIWYFILWHVDFRQTHVFLLCFLTVLYKSIIDVSNMAIRCAAVKSLLLKCCAPPNNPVSFQDLLHLVFRSPWSRECHGWYIGPVSSRALCTSPARPRHTWQNFLLPQRMWSQQQKNKPACYQSETSPGFLTLATLLNYTEVQDTDAFLDACGEYLSLLINVLNCTELLWGKSRRVVGGKSESSM